jgi:hypothetical protein
LCTGVFLMGTMQSRVANSMAVGGVGLASLWFSSGWGRGG